METNPPRSVATPLQDNAVDVVVLGSRGMGSIKASLLGALGLGSVTDHCVQHLRCPVLVVKEGQGGAEVTAFGSGAEEAVQ